MIARSDEYWDIEDICWLLGITEKTLSHNFKRTQENLKKRGIILQKYGRGPKAQYTVRQEGYENE